MIPVYIGRKFKIVLESSVWQPLECEHCHLQWAYRVRVGGIGTGESPYLLDDEGARERAAKQARLALEEDRRISSEGVKRNIACPGCGRYQSDMVERLRARHAAPWGALGVVSLLFGGMVLLRALTVHGTSGAENLVWLACGAMLIAAGVFALAWRRRLQRLFDPNATSTTGRAGSPNWQVGAESLRESPEQGADPDAITRVQYEEAVADALARGIEPPDPIRWQSH